MCFVVNLVHVGISDHLGHLVVVVVWRKLCRGVQPYEAEITHFQ